MVSGTFAPGLLTRWEALGSRRAARTGKQPSWDSDGDCFSPFPFPLCFPVVKQAQLVASHGPVPEALVGSKVLLSTVRAELCFFLFPLFITNDEGWGEILCPRAVAFIHWEKNHGKLKLGALLPPGKVERKAQSNTG